MQSVTPAFTPEPVITSENVVRLTALVCGSACFLGLLGLAGYALNKTGGTEALSGLAEIGAAFSWLTALPA